MIESGTGVVRMRVITGFAKGRKLRTLSGEDVRPTTDRVKEALFSIIQFEIEGRRVLDLFAGSGQLGIEALSRGAASAVFVDSSRDSIEVVRENLNTTQLAQSAQVMQMDSLAFLAVGRRASRGRSKEWVVVVCGVNELGDCFCDICGRGSAGAGELSVELAARIPAASAVVTDGHKSYGFATRGYRHAEVDPRDPSAGDINMVNALHSRLKAFLRRFNGVSTRRLQRYLDWFRYAEAFKGGGMDGRERLFMHEAEGRYWKTRRFTHFEFGDAMVYWTRQLADVSTVV